MTAIRLATCTVFGLACSSRSEQSAQSSKESGESDRTRPAQGSARMADAAPPKPTLAPPSDLASLPEWPVPKHDDRAGETVTVHAADADLVWLASLLVSDGTAMVTTDKGGQLGGGGPVLGAHRANGRP